ncbi:hypothetical protein PF004_g10390 [Phytophthora fragariae]|uniref:Uncharacterized protein n=2 Tax=Phytophthora fragariae TaxID=53985 RepID=A0A6G0P132_9STRA|nr:hypothetical protein PF004_g10390 [Phytophthora fragariae]
MAAPAAGANATMTFHNEPWTAEVARLLLEVDEGWVGYRGDAAWSWHDETYRAFAAVCAERQWPVNSHGACSAMLHALRTGAISMKLSSATRSSDGCAQWSLVEMRELGAQMRRVVDGKSPTTRWAVQLAAFVDAMKAKDASYSIEDRTVVEFAARAGKYVPDPILRLINPNGMTPMTTVKNSRSARRTPTPEKRQNRAPTTATKHTGNNEPPAAVANTRKPRRTPTPEPEERPRRVTRGQATEDVDSDDEPLMPRRSSRSKSARKDSGTDAPMPRRNSRSTSAGKAPITRRGRTRDVESEGDGSYHDPTSEEDGDALWDADLHIPETEESSVPVTQELTSQGELLLAEQPAYLTQVTVSQSRPSQDQLPQNQAQRPSSASSQSRVSSRQDPPVEKSSSPREDPSVEQRNHQVQKRRQDSADQTRTAIGSQHSESPTRQSSRKHRRVQNNDRVHTNDPFSSNTLFRSLNPYDRPGKPWGEFVVEVLLAERAARNEDERDYVQFVRGLYEI